MTDFSIDSRLVLGTVSARRFGQIVRLSIVESRPVVQIIYSMRFIAGFVVADPDAAALRSWRLPVGLLTWLCASSFAYLFDGIHDLVEDRHNGSRRPIASGRLSRRAALAVTITWVVLTLAGALAVGGAFRYLAPALLLLGWAYSAPPVRLKRWTAGSGGTVIAAGLLTYAAAGSLTGDAPSPALIVFALVSSLWMGMVGAVAKDFSDVVGDAAAGRRTAVVVRGAQRTAIRLAANAVGIAVGFLLVAVLLLPVLIVPAVAIAGGAAAVAITSLVRREDAHPRRPYRCFMVTQYVAHLAFVAAALVTVLL